MIKWFNSVQIAALVAGGPILLGLLHSGTFSGAAQLFWIGILVYAILFCITVMGLRCLMDHGF